MALLRVKRLAFRLCRDDKGREIGWERLVSVEKWLIAKIFVEMCINIVRMWSLRYFGAFKL